MSEADKREPGQAEREVSVRKEKTVAKLSRQQGTGVRRRGGRRRSRGDQLKVKDDTDEQQS
jgi:hypothetical protein